MKAYTVWSWLELQLVAYLASWGGPALSLATKVSPAASASAKIASPLPATWFPVSATSPVRAVRARIRSVHTWPVPIPCTVRPHLQPHHLAVEGQVCSIDDVVGVADVACFAVHVQEQGQLVGLQQ